MAGMHLREGPVRDLDLRQMTPGPPLGGPRTPAVLALLIVLLVSRSALAQEGHVPARDDVPSGETEEEKESSPLYETVVRGRRVEQESASISKVRRGDIVRQGAHSASDVLEHDPSIHATSGPRGERIFSLRGFDQRQVVVLIDGSPAYVPYDGQVDLNMVPAELIDHITIIRGPGSVLYGPNGLGGAINIVTRRPGVGPLGEVSFESGRAGFVKLCGLHTYRVGPLAYTVHGGLKRRNAFPLSSRFSATANENGALRENSDRSMYHLGTRLRLQLTPDHELEGGLLFLDGSRGVPPSTTDAIPRFWRFNVWRGVRASLGHHGQYLEDLEVDEQLFVSLFDNLLDSHDDKTYSSQTSYRAFHSWYHDWIFGGRVRARYRAEQTPWGPTEMRLWTSAQHDLHREEWSAEWTKSESPQSRSRTIITVAPEAEAFFSDRWRAVVAFQVDVEVPGEDQETQVGLGPLVSARFDPRENLILRATVARRTRFPTLRERYSGALGFQVPNPDLRPESAWNIGLESIWRAARWLAIQIAVYDAEVDDLIERVHLGAGKDQLQNIGAARLLGAELTFKLTPVRWLHFKAGYSLLHARRTETTGSSDKLQYRPAHKASLDLMVAPWRWMELSTFLRLVGPQDFQHPDTQLWGSLGAFAVWDARMDLRPTRWASLWISVKNILDSNYQTEYGFPDPGWQLWVGLRLAYCRDST